MKTNQYKNLKVRVNGGVEISLKQEIGQGGFSNVYSTSNNSYVAKVMNLDFSPSLKSFTNEKKWYGALKNAPNIVSFLSAEKINGNQLGILLIENCPKGSLVDILALSPKQQLSEEQILRIIYEISLGLIEIHHRQLVHRDIKLENVLFAEDGKYKLCDLGSMTNDIILRIGDRDITEVIEEVNQNTTPMYRAPEQLEPSSYRDCPLAQKVDIFALGVVAYILCFKKPPFESALGAITGFMQWPEIPPISAEFQNLIEIMLAEMPESRPSAAKVISILKNELKFDYINDGHIDPFIFSKNGRQEAKASWYQIIQKKIFGVFYDTQGWSMFISFVEGFIFIYFIQF